MKTKSHRFTVRGRFPFPLDMLRYDGAFPRSEGDAHVMTAACNPGSLAQARQIFEIELTALHPREWEPTYGRWESFGWKVDPLSHEDGV